MYEISIFCILSFFMNLLSVLQEHVQDNLFTWFNTDTEEEVQEDLIKNLQVVDSTKQQEVSVFS